MKHKLLSIIMFVAAVSQIACSDDKPDPAKCAADPACKAGVMAMSAPQLFPLGSAGAAGAGQVPVAGNTLMNSPFRVSSALAKAGVTDGAVKAQSLKVAAAIAQDDQNPESTYYKSPTPDVSKLTSEAPVAANRSPSGSAATIQPITQVSASSDSGEATR